MYALLRQPVATVATVEENEQTIMLELLGSAARLQVPLSIR